MAHPNEALREAAAKSLGISVDELDDESIEEEVPEGTEEPEAGTPPANQPEGSDNPTEDEAIAELPEDYFGENIREYAKTHGVEAAKAFHSALQDANRVVASRMQELAEQKKAYEAAARQAALEAQVAPPTPEPETDEALLERVGIDPSILEMDDVGKPIVAVVKMMLEQNAQLQDLTNQTQQTAAEREFFGTLEQLQAAEGKLPPEFSDHDSLIAIANETQVFDPTALYWRIMGPVQAAARKAPTPTKTNPDKDGRAGLREVKRTMGTSRRKGSTGTPPVKPKSLEEHFRAVAKTQGVTDLDAVFSS